MIKMILIALAIAAIVMTIIWLIQLKTKNAGIVDIAWSYNFPIIAIVYYFTGDGFEQRKLLILGMVLIWGVRLGTHLFVRVLGHHDTEDTRYAALRIEWRDNLNYKFFRFFQFQAVTNVVLSIPFLILCMNTDPEIHTLEWVGVCIWAIAIIGESVADWQLKEFKKKKENKGKVCQNGLWYYSRHPNYFFEWLIWVGYFVTAVSSPYGCWAIASPLVMICFLIKVTGVPMTEEQSVKSRGQAYIDYQKSTSMFVPWFKKK
jgi:steroid 5-alpha reductase family enzyme